MTIIFLLFAMVNQLSSCTRESVIESDDQRLKSSIIAVAQENHIPTLSVLIKRKNEELKFQYKEADKHIEPINIYGISSTTKFLCSLIFLKYVEENKIKLQDHITDFINSDSLPSLPWIYSIKIENLLNHTSGIPDYTQNQSWISSIISMNPPKNFTEKMQMVIVPDTSLALNRFSYSNSNYVILEKILEVISGKKATEIFNTFYADLKLSNTSLNMPSTGNQAFFAQQVNSISNISDWKENYGFEGGAYTTAEDLSSLLQQTFIDKTIISNKSLAMMQCWVNMDLYSLNFGNGKISYYGLGLMKYEVSGRTYVGHSGSSLKYQCFAFIEPATGTQVILLTNCSGKYYNHAFLIEVIDNIVFQNI